MSSSPSLRPLAWFAALVPVLAALFIGFSSATVEDSTGPYADPKPVSCGSVWFPNLDKVSAAGVPRCHAVAGPRGVFAGALLVSGMLGLVVVAVSGGRSPERAAQP